MPSWPAISGLSAGWLVAAFAAAAIPIVIHLIAKRRAPLVAFPAARFVLRAQAGARSRRRLRDRLLMMLRALALLLLALAFGRPLFESAAHSGVGLGASSSLVVVLDASASMQRVESGVTLFDAARERALELLDEARRAGGRAAVVLLTASPDPILPRLTENIPRLMEEVGSIEPTSERGDARRALELAEQLLNDRLPGRRVIVILSDMQATQWKDAATVARSELRFERIGGEAAGNLALGPLTVAPARPRVGAAARMGVTVRNFSDVPRTAMVRFTRGGEAIGETVVTIPAWEEREGSVPLRFDAAEQEPIGATIAPDEFALDDVAAGIADVVDAPRAALITVEPGAGGASLFLRAALAASTGAPPVVIAAGEWDADDLDAVDIVAIGAEVLPGSGQRAALRAFAERGGVVLRFIDPMRPEPNAGQTSADRADWSITHAPIGEPIAQARRVRIAPGASIMDEEASLAGVLRAIEGMEVRGTMRAILAPGAAAMLETEAGPVVARRIIGGGAAVDIALDLDPARSAFARSPAFPALVHALLESEREASRSTPAGAAIDPAESDLRAMTDDPAEGVPARSAPMGANAPSARAEDRPMVEGWPWILLGVLVLLMVEGWLRQQPMKRGSVA